MKVLIVFNHPAPYKVKLFNELATKIDLTVIFERAYAKDRSKLFYAENEYFFKNEILKSGYFGKENSFSLKVRNYIKENKDKFDLIVMNGYSTITEQIAINYMISEHIPYVLYINGGIAKEDECNLKRKLKRKYISNAIAYLSPNDVSDSYLKFYGAKNKIYRYPYSTYFDKEIIKAIPSDEEIDNIRKENNLPDGKLFISASNFIKRKNNTELFSKIKNENCSLVLYGQGKLKGEYIRFLKNNGIKNVILRDFVSSKKLREIMSACDGFITLSKEDIYGHTTLEAFSAGIPVISSENVTSSLSVIKNDVNGFLIELNEDFKKAINRINRKSMAEECLKTAREYTIDKEAEKIAEDLQEIAK